MRAGLVASTETPGRTAPDVSRTVPAIDCAYKSEGKLTQSAAKSSVRTIASACDVVIGAPKLAPTPDGSAGQPPSKPKAEAGALHSGSGRKSIHLSAGAATFAWFLICLLYTSDAADERS